MMSMYSKTNVLKRSSFNFIMHMLNIALWGHQHQTLNRYFAVNNGNNFPYHATQIGQVEKVQRTAARWTCRRWRNTSSVRDMLEELEWPSLETRREQSSLTFFYKIRFTPVLCLLIKISI